MRAVFLLWLAFAVSCSGVQKAEDPSKPPPPETTVEVKNLKKVDFNLYVLKGASRYRLGTTPGMTTRTFVIPAHLVADFNYLRFGLETIGTFGGKDGIGSERHSTSEQELPVRPGQQLSLTIN